MTTVFQSVPSASFNPFALLRTAALGLVVFIAACGGSADAPPPAEGAPAPPAAVAPVITQQPASLTVVAGQAASFTVGATGTAPLAYQWQRNGANIAGATAAIYSMAATAPTDTSAVYRAIVSNVAGNATSNNATLTVTTAPPVLTTTTQPASSSVTAGTAVSFTVAATCSSGTLNIQWQRNNGVAGAFVAIPGATTTSVNVSPAISDDGAMFRAALDCSGQSATTTAAATLTVTAPGGVMLDLLLTVGLRDQALLSGDFTIDRNADDSYTTITGNQLKKLNADLLSITPLAGTTSSGSADGPSASATFNRPFGLTHDAAGNAYIADTGNNVIRRIAADGTVSTLAGTAGAAGATDGAGSAARFNSPYAIAFGPDGDLYVADAQNGMIRRVTTAGAVSTYAGSTTGYADSPTPLLAQFFSPRGIAVAANGDVLVSDTGNSRVRRILRSGNAAGAVQTLAGSGDTNANASPRDGIGTSAVIVAPGNMVLVGNTLTLRDGAGLLRQIDLTTAVVTTFAGSHLHGGMVDGPASLSSLNQTGGGLATAPSGGFMLADGDSIRSVDANGYTETLANNRSGSATDAGIGVLKQLPLGTPRDALAGNASASLTVDPAGNVIVATAFPTLLRRVSPIGTVTLVAGLDGAGAPIDGTGSAAQFAGLGAGLGHDAAGSLYVSDICAVRKVDPQGAVTLLSGQRYDFQNAGSSCGGVDGNAASAKFGVPLGLTVGTDGNVYVADEYSFAIRRIDATTGNVTTIAGALGQQDTNAPDGPATTTARFSQPLGIAAAPDGSLVVLDAARIRRVSADRSTVSTIDTSSVTGQINSSAIAVDADGTLYVGTANGLWSMKPGQTATRLIAGGPDNAVVLGPSPHLSDIVTITVLAPKQIVLMSGGMVLKATLP